jgi:hypothetical protein
LVVVGVPTTIPEGFLSSSSWRSVVAGSVATALALRVADPLRLKPLDDRKTSLHARRSKVEEQIRQCRAAIQTVGTSPTTGRPRPRTATAPPRAPAEIYRDTHDEADGVLVVLGVTPGSTSPGPHTGSVRPPRP